MADPSLPTPPQRAPRNGKQQQQGDTVVIAYDGFQTLPATQDGHVVKKLTIYNVTEEAIQTWCFEAPFPWESLTAVARNANQFISDYINGCRWYEGGFTPYKDMTRILLKHTDTARLIYSKGQLNVKYLNELIGRPVLDIDDMLRDRHATPLENIRKGLPTLRCLEDHGRKKRLRRFTQTDYPCSQDRAYYWGHILKYCLKNNNNNNGSPGGNGGG